MTLPAVPTTTVPASQFKGQNLDVDFGISDIRQVSAKTIIAYGDSALGKSTNARYFAQWMYEQTGLPVRLISAEDSSKQVFEGLIDIDVVKSVFLTKTPHTVAAMRRLGRGEWPVFKDGVIAEWLPWKGGFSAYIIEGITSFAEQMHEECREKRWFLGEQKDNAFTIEGGEQIALASKFSYNFVQMEMLRAIKSFAMLSGIERVLWTSHETKGVEEGTGKQIRGPALVGSAKTDSVKKFCGTLLHFDGYPTEDTDPNSKLKVSRTKVRVWFTSHPDAQLPNVTYPAKVTLPPELLSQLWKQFPGGFFMPEIVETGLKPNLADFLTFEQQLSKVGTQGLLEWKQKLDAARPRPAA